MKNITIKDIAKHARVSSATVSRVLNKNYYVSPRLTNRVLETVRKFNFFPNSIARSLKTTKTYTIGLIVSNITNNFFTEVAKETGRLLLKKNYNLIVCSTESKEGEERKYLELLLGKKIDGLILNTMGENIDFICEISKRIPIVLLNRKIYNNNTFKGDFIGTDCIGGTYILTRHLLEYGHRKIGIINGPLGVSTGRERYEGFIKAMREYNIQVNNDYPYRYDGNFTTLSGYMGMEKLMNLLTLPTAVIVMNNNMLVGALEYCKEYELKIPGNISICSFGNINNINLLYVKPTIIEENPTTIGEDCAKMILERIEKKTFLPNRMKIYQPKLVTGNTVSFLEEN